MARRLDRLNLPRLDGRASPSSFGAGRTIESFGGGAGPEAYGAGRRVPTAGPEAYGANDARDLRILAASGATAFDTLLRGQVAERAAKRRDDVLAGRRMALQAGVEWDRRLLEAKKAAPPDAKDFTSGILAQFDEYRETTVDGLEGEQRQIVEDELLQLGGSLQREATNFESQQRLKAREADAAAAIQIAQNSIFARPQDHGRILEGLLTDIEASDLPEFAKEELANSTQAALAGSLWAARVERDPYAAREALLAGDSETLQGLQFGARATLLNTADSNIYKIEVEQRRQAAEARAEQREREAAARAARIEAQSYARLVYDDELAAAERGQSTGPEAARAIVDAFGPEKAAPLLDRINSTREVAGLTANFATMSNQELAAAVEGLAPSGPGFELEANLQEKAVVAAQKVLEARRKDPAIAVAAAFPQVAAGLISNDPNQRAAALRQSMQIQGDIYGLAPEQRQLLTPQVKDQIVSRFKNAATTDERIALLNSYTTALGDDTVGRQVLRELESGGLPAEARFAMERYSEGDITGARELMGTLTTDPAKLPKLGAAKAEEVRGAVDSLIAEGSPASITTRLANMSRQPGLFARAEAERNTLLRLTEQYAAAGDDAGTAATKAQRALYGDVELAGSDDLGYVRVPSGIDHSALEDALERARANIDLSAFAPTGTPTTGEQEGAMALARRDHEAWVQSIRESGIWTESQGGYVLLEPTTGRSVGFYTLDMLMGTMPPTRPLDEFLPPVIPLEGSQLPSGRTLDPVSVPPLGGGELGQ